MQLYAIHSPSGNEKKMRKFLKKQIVMCGAESVVDAFGNILVTKGESDTYPCLAAHIDQVQNIHSKDFRCIEVDDVVFGFSPKTYQQQGLGADDKNGIFICLESLMRFDVLKVAFFVGEETGCVGSSKVDLSFFSDCRFIIEPDRKGGADLITSMCCGQVCSDEFINVIGADKFGYKEEQGSITDVGELVERGVGISCLNLSCGYHNAHTDKECTNLKELENCMNFVWHIIENVKDVYPFKHILYSYQGSYAVKMSNERYWDYYDFDFETMEEIFLSEQMMTFDEIMSNYGSHFWIQDIDLLRDIYNDVVYYHSPCESGTYNELF